MLSLIVLLSLIVSPPSLPLAPPSSSFLCVPALIARPACLSACILASQIASTVATLRPDPPANLPDPHATATATGRVGNGQVVQRDIYHHLRQVRQ